ncbi:MAG: hypothetical protein JXX28_11345 [Deltaproteobacteria bacterium]|nr:hypothetical protein [Deltaproteobacteria bacterium]
MTLLILALVGCTKAPPAVAVPTSALARCAASECADAADRVACEASACAHQEARWRLIPQTLGYDGQVAFVEVAVEHTPERYGPIEVPREEPVYVGVTLFRDDGSEIDLAVQTRFADALQDPFFLSGEVGPGVESVVMGLWSEKVEPCVSDRPGCREFGFVLDHALASWPPAFYDDFRRQRFLPPEVPVQVYGVDLDRAVQALGAAEEAIAPWLDPFGAAAVRGPTLFRPDLSEAAVVYHHPQDGPIAAAAAEALRAPLGRDVAALLDPSERQGLELLIPGPVPLCLEGCPAESPLDACMAERCAP